MTHKKSALIAVSTLLVILFALVFVLLGFASDKNVSDYTDKGINKLADDDTPLEDGQVASQYDISTVPSDYMAVGEGSGRDMAFMRNNPSGKYMLVSDITVTALDFTTVFSGVLDGNGYKIIVNAENTSFDSGRVAGLFSELNGGTIKNLTVQVDKFRAGTVNNYTTGGMMVAVMTNGAGGQVPTIENCKVILNYSPTSAANDENGGFCDFYLYQSKSTGKDSTIRLGGIAGATNGNVIIKEVTLDNRTTGNYGFALKGWRVKGSLAAWEHSDGFHCLGGFIASTDGTNSTVQLINITLAGNASSKFTTYNESTSNYRYNAGKMGGVVGYIDNGSVSIDGLIMSYPIVVSSSKPGHNFVMTNMNYTDSSAAGSIVGWDDDSNTSITIRDVFYVDGAETEWMSGKKNNLSGAVTFNPSLNPKFDNTRIYFYGATKVAPDSPDLVHQIQYGDKYSAVTDQLILKDGEVSGPTWVYAPKSGSAGGSVNLNHTRVMQGTLELGSAFTLTGQDDNYILAEKLYDGNNVAIPTLTLKDTANTVTIRDAYNEANPNRNTGEHILNFNKDTILNAGYNAYTYNGKTVLGNAMTGKMYVPSAVSIGGQSTVPNIIKNIKVNVTPLPIEVGFVSTNFITYGDSVEAAKANNSDVRILSVNGVQGAVAPDTIASWDLAGYVPYAQNTGSLVPLTVENVVMSGDSTANYIITATTKNVAIVARQITGNISLADGVSLVYDGQPKTAKFTITKGAEDDPEIGSKITFDFNGTDNVNVGTFTVRAVLPAVDGVANYAFSSDSVTSAEYTITPMPVQITAVSGQSKSYDGQVFSDFASLFDIPEGADGEPLKYDFAITKDGAPVGEIKDAGTYNISATFQSGQNNYTSNTASVDFVVKKAQIKGTITMPEDMSYDGKAKVPTYTFEEGYGLFVEGEEITFEYSESNINAGTVTVTANLPNSNYEFVVDEAASETQSAPMTIEKRKVTLGVENIVKTYDGEIYDFSAVEVSGTEGFVDEFTVSVSSPTATADAGSYALVITTSLDGNTNYEITRDEDKTLTINAKAVSLTIDNASKTYDGKLFDFTGYAVNGMDGFVAKDNVQASVSAVDEKADKGVYTLQITTTADANKNYVITKDSDKTLTVNARKVSLTIDNAVSTYNGKAYDFSGYDVVIGEEGFVAEDNITVSVSAEGNATDKGVYPLKVTSTADGNANYVITRSEDKTLTINALNVSITAKEPQSKIFDGQIFDGFDSLFNIPQGVDGQPLEYDYTVTLGGEPVESILNAGEYTVSATLKAGQDNYLSDTASVVYTVNVLEVTIEAKQAEATSMYDGSEVSVEELKSYFNIPTGVDGMPLEVTIAISGAGSTILNAGIYTVSMSLADKSGNYTANTASLTFKLMKQTITIPTPADQEFVYNASEQTFVIAEDSHYTVEGNKGTNAGNYEAILTLVNTDNYQWSDGTTEPQVFEWTIKKATSVVNPQVEGEHFYDGHEMPSIAIADGDTPGAIAWQEEVLTFGTNTYNWTFTPTDITNYKSAKGTYTLNVEAIALASLSAQFDAGENPIYTSTSLDELKNYLVVKGINNDGSDYGVIEGTEYTLSGTLTAGTSTVTVNYNGLTVNFEINNVIGVVLERIEITSAPKKTVYTVFEKLDTTGMVITAYYTDGTSEVVTDDCTADVDTMTVGTDKVTFTYTDATGTKTVTLDVVVNTIKVNVPDVDASQHFVYNASEQTFVVPQGEQYTVSGNKATNAGDYNTVISLKDKTNYEWTSGGNADIEYPWAIEKMIIKGAIRLPQNLTFDGKNKQAEFDITVGTLFANDAIAISYDGDTLNAGTVTVSVALPSANYEFEQSVQTSVEMVIAPYELEVYFNNLTVVYNTPTEEFDISSIVASVRGVQTNEIQIGDQTYTYTTSVEYANPDNTYKQGDVKDTTYELKVTVTIDGLDSKNYTYQSSAMLKVIATPLEGVLVADGSGMEYDGNTHGATLTETTASPEDYEIQYSLKGKNQWSTELPVNAGTYTVRVVATTDSYSGERINNIEIVILPKNVVITANQTEVSKAYKGEVNTDELKSYFTAPAGVKDEGALALAITVTGAGEVVNGVGVYTVTAKLDASLTNYKASAVSFKYTVVFAEVTAPVPEVQSFTYSGALQTFVIATDSKYTVSGNTATNAGSYSATVRLADKKNYIWADTKDNADKSFAWSIAKADATVNPQVEDKTYYDGHSMPAISTKAGDTEGTIVWTQDTLSAAVSEYGWEFTPADTLNYNSATGKYTLKVVSISLQSIDAQLKPGVFVYTSSTLDEIKLMLDITGTNNDGSTVENLPSELIRIEGQIVEGAQVFTVYYTDDESIQCQVTITVTKVELSSIEAVFEQGDFAVFPNTPLDALRPYLTVNGINNDGKPYGVIGESDYTLSGTLDRQKSTITVKYTGSATSLEVKDTTFVVNVSTAALDRIEIQSAPTQLSYTAFDEFNADGLVVVAYYTDSTSRIVEDYEVVGGESMQVKFASEGIEISYTEDDVTKSAILTGLTVEKFKVDYVEPTAQNFIFNGKAQTFAYQPGKYYTMQGNVQTNAGNYTAYVVLNDKENSEWNFPEGSGMDMTMDMPVEWSIMPKTVTVSVKPDIEKQKVYDGVMITKEQLKETFELNIYIGPDDDISPEDVDFEVVLNAAGEGIVDAGYYTVSVKLTAKSSNFRLQNTPSYNYRIRKADKEMLADMTVGYKTLNLSLTNGIDNAVYSFNNKDWSSLDSLQIAVDMQDKYTIYLRYEDSTNYNASNTIKLERNVTKEALLAYLKENFDDTIGKEDLVKFEEFLGYAKNPDGESKEYDALYADLYAQYEQVSGLLKQAITSALATGSKAAGYTSVVAASLTLTSFGTGLAFVALSIKSRKRQQGTKSRRMLIATALVIAMLTGVVFAFAGCEEVEVDNMADILDIIKTYNGLKVEVYEGEEAIYVYDNGAISSNKYNVMLNVNDIIGNKGGNNLSITKENLVNGYSIIMDESTGTATVKGKLQNTSIATINGAEVEIVCNLKTKTASKYMIKYADEWGYTIIINLI